MCKSTKVVKGGERTPHYFTNFQSSVASFFLTMLTVFLNWLWPGGLNIQVEKRRRIDQKPKGKGKRRGNPYHTRALHQGRCQGDPV